MNYQKVIDNVAKSKKYRGIYLPTVERIVARYSPHYQGKNLEKIVKQKLHQMWGAFDIVNAKNTEYSPNPKETALRLMKQQTSTKERLPYMDELFCRIFAEVQPKKIVEFGCGYNALSYYWFPPNVEYIGYDIDSNMVTHVRNVFRHYRTTTAEIHQGDIFIDSIPCCDCLFLFKVVPLLELQEKGFTYKLISGLEKKTVIITFPLQTLSGRQDNRKEQYQSLIEEICKKCHRNFTSFLIPNESVFILR